MKAIRFREHGGPEVMRLEDVPQPEPGPGMARVKIEAIGVNFIDTYHRSGQYNVTLPFTPGSEAAGTVDAIGTDVTEVQPGDRVAYANIPGAYAEYAVVPAAKLIPIPAGVDSHVTAAVILQGMTAHYLTFDTFPLQPRHKALIHAAAGGTGQLLVQIAKRCGAFVIGTVSTEEKAEIARRAGADAVILYTQQDFEAETKQITDGAGVDVVYDSVGKDTFDKSLNCLHPRGYMVLFGQSSGPSRPLTRRPQCQRFAVPTVRRWPYVLTRDDLLRRAGDVLDWVARGELQVRIDRTFPLADAAEAHKVLTGRETMGKVLLAP
jgi:NADPH2:quinone reductase